MYNNNQYAPTAPAPAPMSQQYAPTAPAAPQQMQYAPAPAAPQQMQYAAPAPVAPPAAPQQQKRYSPFSEVTLCIDQNGVSHVHLTVCEIVTKIGDMRTTQGGKPCVFAKIPVSGCSGFLAKHLNVAENAITTPEGVVWVQAAFFGKDAERLVNSVQRHGENATYVVSGNVSVDQRQTQDGRVFTNVNMAVNRFSFIREKRNNNAAAASQYAVPAAPAAPAAPQQQYAPAAPAAPQQQYAPAAPAAPQQQYAPAYQQVAGFPVISDDGDLPF